jgi:hypothetical protein
MVIQHRTAKVHCTGDDTLRKTQPLNRKHVITLLRHRTLHDQKQEDEPERHCCAATGSASCIRKNSRARPIKDCAAALKGSRYSPRRVAVC